MASHRDALAEPWHGVSLGGWLLLEPGPSYPLFEQHPNSEGEELRCEWTLLKSMRQLLGTREAREVIRRHRETHITKQDFERIRACGLNAVRLPFGYWVVTGPTGSEPYFGPAIEYIDRAVDWAEECGLQLVLDLHGCPGGESGEAPCGHRQRPAGRWHWNQWRTEESLQVLETLALRYSKRRCVTGIEVCNEPSNTIPWSKLLRFFDKAVDTVRQAGMPSNRVAVVLPVFQRPEEEFARRWQSLTGGRHKNICFDVHCYHCFENEFNGKTLAQQLRAVEENAEMLRKYPMVVGEWSLALGVATWCTCGSMTEDEVYALFGRLQQQAFREASHGHFFWNWTEGDDREWNFQKAYQLGLLSNAPLQLPPWDKTGEDPLEEVFHPAPPQADARIMLGDPIYLRVFYGRYIDVEGSCVGARWADKGIWQQLSFCPPAEEASKAGTKLRREIRNGDVVRVRARNGRFLSVDSNGTIVATRSSSGPTAEFVVHIEHGETLRHRSIMYLRNRATSLVMDADEEDEGLFTRFEDFGWWQQLSAEKSCEDIVPVTPEKPDVKLLRAEAFGAASVTPLKGRRRVLAVKVLDSVLFKDPLAVGKPAAFAAAARPRTAAPKCRRWVKSSPYPAVPAFLVPNQPGKQSSEVSVELPKNRRCRVPGSLEGATGALDSILDAPPAKVARVR